MSPIEIWGPSVWNLFHTLSEKINDAAYPYIKKSLFNLIIRICRFLPCPECATDATKFLAKINIDNIKNKEEFKNTFYLFHNYVNAKKRKPLFNFSNINVYQRYKLIPVVNNFIVAYNTKGNMKLLTESFQRQFVLKEFKSWFSSNIRAFIPSFKPPTTNIILQEEVVVHEEQPVSQEEVVEEEPSIVQEEEPSIVQEEEPSIVQEEEPVVQEEEPSIVQEEPVVQEEEPVVEEELVVQEEEPVVEDCIGIKKEQLEEEVVSTKQTKTNKKNKKKKIN